MVTFTASPQRIKPAFTFQLCARYGTRNMDRFLSRLERFLPSARDNSVLELLATELATNAIRNKEQFPVTVKFELFKTSETEAEIAIFSRQSLPFKTVQKTQVPEGEHICDEHGRGTAIVAHFIGNGDINNAKETRIDNRLFRLEGPNGRLVVNGAAGLVLFKYKIPLSEALL